jgi:DNA polymerase-1
MKRIAMVDGDIVAYQQSGLCEVPTNWGNDIWTLHADAKEAKQKVDVFLSDLKEELEADEMLLAVSGPENFRKVIYPPYKEHRKAQRKPMVLGEVKEHLIFKHKARWVHILEADDIIGLWATTPEKGVEKIIVSLDKDFNTIPGLSYNWNHPEEKVVETPEIKADYNFLVQTLTGDQADGYPGCPGIGAKKAADLMDGFKSIEESWPKLVAAYNKAGFGEGEALVQARCARILRHGEYNFKTKKVALWVP